MATHRIVRQAGAYRIETTAATGEVVLHAEGYPSKLAAMRYLRTLRDTPEAATEAVLVERRVSDRRTGDRRIAERRT